MAVNRLGCGSRLTHKDRLAASLRAHGASDVAPLTFTLPAEREAFLAFCRQERRARREEEDKEDREEDREEREEERGEDEDRGEDEEDGNGDGQRQGDETTDTAVTAVTAVTANTATATRLPLSPPLSPRLSPPLRKHRNGRKRRRPTRPTRWRPTAWIVKPWNTGRGRGIYMTRDAAYIVKRVADLDERCVVCRYVELAVLRVCVCVCCILYFCKYYCNTFTFLSTYKSKRVTVCGGVYNHVTTLPLSPSCVAMDIVCLALV